MSDIGVGPVTDPIGARAGVGAGTGVGEVGTPTEGVDRQTFEAW